MQIIGKGYDGSPTLETSVANQEIIPSPSIGTIRRNFYKFSFCCDEDCTIIINGIKEIYWRAGVVFQVEPGDQPITSFKIKEGGKQYYIWAGAYM